MADEEFDTEAARAAAVEELRADPDHRVSIVDEANSAMASVAEHGENEPGDELGDDAEQEPAK